MADYNINAVTRRVVFTGSAGVGPYAFSFEVLDQNDVAVYFNTTLLTLTTDYTVVVNANGTGSVTIVTGSGVPSTPTASDTIIIIGARDIERVTDFVTAGDLLASSLNEQLDALTIFDQQLAEEGQRSMRAPVYDPALVADGGTLDMTLPPVADRIDTVMAFDSDGNPVKGPTVSGITTITDLAADITTLADIEDGTVATDAISDTAAIASDVTTVAGISANVTTVAGNTANINTVSGNTSNINTVAGIDSDVTTVSGIAANVTTAAGISADITAVAADTTDIGTVSANIANVNSVAAIDSDVTTVAGMSSADITTVAGISANVTTVAGIDADVTTVAGIAADVTAAATNVADIQAISTAIADVITVANDLNEATSEIDVVANNIANVNAVGTDIANVNTVASNLADVNAFADTYFISATAPSSPTQGDLWFDTDPAALLMKVYDGSGWVNAGSSVNGTSQRVSYTATSGQTTFAATYDAGFVDVYLNGIKLIDGTDFTATSGTSIVLASGAALNDTVDIVAYGTFTLLSTVLDDLSDVSTAGASSGQVLSYNGASWSASTPSVPTLSSLGIANHDQVTVDGSGNVDVTGDAAITGHSSIGVNAVASTRALTVAGATDGSGSSILVCYNSSLSPQFSVRDDGLVTASGSLNVDGNLGIGTSSPSRKLSLDGGAGTQTWTGYQQAGTEKFVVGLDASGNPSLYGTQSAPMIFYTNNTESMRISSGSLLVGTTVLTDISSSGTGNEGAYIKPDGQVGLATSNGTSLIINRKTSDGDLVEFRKDGTTVGSIKCRSSGGNLQIATSNSGIDFGGSSWNPTSVGSIVDNTIDVGTASFRFDDIYATNGTIQTSDANEKQQIAALTDAEITAAKAISALFKTYKWNSAVTEKGDAARTHTGVIAQDVQAAMTAAGLDAGDYAFFISSTWWETQTEVLAVEAADAVLDEDGNVVTEAVEAQEAYTRTDTYDTAEEAPEGAVERTRLGIRYPELLAFVGAATEQRLANIETRLAALENV